MKERVAWTIRGGDLVQNAGPETLVNNTTLIKTFTVPVGEKWVIDWAYMFNVDDVARACTIRVDDGTNVHKLLFDGSLAQNESGQWPNATFPWTPFVLRSGWRVLFIWNAGGASAGGTAYRTLYTRVIRGGYSAD